MNGFDRPWHLAHHSLGSFQGFQLHKFHFRIFDKRDDISTHDFFLFFDDDWLLSLLHNIKVIVEYQK